MGHVEKLNRHDGRILLDFTGRLGCPDPTEREALRSVASWQTFAADARFMEEGERADHVMVILGGRAKVCVRHNGGERVLAVAWAS